MMLLRFSTEEYLTKFQKDGHLYCNSIQSFSEYKDSVGRGDEYENVFEQIYSSNGTLTIKPMDSPESETQEFAYRDQKLKMMATTHYVNVFCLYSINLSDHEEGKFIELPDEIKKLGTHCLIIFNVAEFVNRLKKALLNYGADYSLDFVKYVDYSKYIGKKTIFDKPIEFAYQKEYRIAIGNRSVSPIEINIGSIEDISIIRDSNETNELSFRYF